MDQTCANNQDLRYQASSRAGHGRASHLAAMGRHQLSPQLLCVCALQTCMQVCGDALSTWQATIASQFSDVGFAPAGVMLSAYGYFDGTLPSNNRSHNTTNTDSSCSSKETTTVTSSSSSSSGSSSKSGRKASGRQAVQYSAFGAAVTEVELDVLTGERRVLATHIAYDCGYSLNPRIDLGQVEGAFVMGECSQPVHLAAAACMRST